MMETTDRLPPPSELLASIVGAGSADDSEPSQFTMEPSSFPGPWKPTL